MEARGTPSDGEIWLFDMPKNKKFHKSAIGRICYLAPSKEAAKLALKEFKHKYDGGITEFVKHINSKKPILVNKNEKEVFKKPVYVTSSKNNVVVECSFEWNAGYSEEVLPFTNNIPQKDGGTHLLGFRSALTRVINKYSNDRNNKRTTS